MHFQHLTSAVVMSWANIVFNSIMCTILPTTSIILPKKHQEDFVLLRQADFNVTWENKQPNCV